MGGCCRLPLCGFHKGHDWLAVDWSHVGKDTGVGSNLVAFIQIPGGEGGVWGDSSVGKVFDLQAQGHEFNPQDPGYFVLFSVCLFFLNLAWPYSTHYPNTRETDRQISGTHWLASSQSTRPFPGQ